MLKKIRNGYDSIIDEVKNYFQIKNEKLVFGSRSYELVNAGHQFKKHEKTFL